MLLSLKTRPVPHGSRAVPNGGLGGCVVISPTHTSVESVWDEPRSFQHGQKLTPSRLCDMGATQRASNALRSRLDAPLPATPLTPLHPRGLSVMIAGEEGAQEWPTMQQWPVDEVTKWNNQVSVTCTPMSPEFSQRSMPAELPGSLLLPSQGFGQMNPPCTPPRPFRQFRVNDSKSSFDTVPSLTNSCESSPESGSFSPSSLRSYLHKQLPALPPVNDMLPCNFTHLPTNHTTTRMVDAPSRLFASMNARELLLSLQTLYTEEKAKQWMITMERELSRFRGWTKEQSTQRVTGPVTMSLFFEELRGALVVAQEICQTHDAAFRRVQESFDANRRTHGVKLEQIEAKIYDMLTRLQDKQDARLQIFRHEEIAVLLTFRQSIDILSNFIQSQLVYQLRQQKHGLSQELARLLRTFDNNHSVDNREASFDADESDATTTTEWVQFEDLEDQLQRTQEMLQETQKTLMFSHDELRNTSHNYDEAVVLVDRYQAKLNRYHNEADAIREKLLAQHDLDTARATSASGQTYHHRHHHHNFLSHVNIPRTRMTWDHHAATTAHPTSPPPTSTPVPNANRCSMGPKMTEIHTGINDLIGRLQSQTAHITSLSDQVADLRVDNAVLNRQNTSLSQEIYARHAAFGDAADKRFHRGMHVADVTGKAKGKMRQLKLILHHGIRRSL